MVFAVPAALFGLAYLVRGGAQNTTGTLTGRGPVFLVRSVTIALSWSCWPTPIGRAMGAVHRSLADRLLGERGRRPPPRRARRSDPSPRGSCRRTGLARRRVRPAQGATGHPRGLRRVLLRVRPGQPQLPGVVAAVSQPPGRNAPRAGVGADAVRHHRHADVRRNVPHRRGRPRHAAGRAVVDAGRYDAGPCRDAAAARSASARRAGTRTAGHAGPARSTTRPR